MDREPQDARELAIAARPVPPSATPASARDTQKADAALAPDDRRESAALMRVNHAGEVAAQALYQGHALVARSPEIREHMLQAAAEERSRRMTWASS